MSQEQVKRYLILSGVIAVLAGSYVFIKLPDFVGRRQKEAAVLRETTVVVPEGLNVRQIGEILEKAKLFSGEKFILAAQKKEGYLFPDTYRFYKNAKPEDVIIRMENNFSKKITPEILNAINKTGHTIEEIVIIASILEEEVKSTEDRKIVAGILWKRLANNIGLNVDSALTYILGKESKELTQADLKIDSPYNTYRYRGLPPTPISNPGLDAILSAANPSASPYFYYLTDKNNNVHYAKTLEEHGLNKYKYLR